MYKNFSVESTPIFRISSKMKLDYFAYLKYTSAVQTLSIAAGVISNQHIATNFAYQ